MKIYYFLILEKFKDTSSAQLCAWPDGEQFPLGNVGDCLHDQPAPLPLQDLAVGHAGVAEDALEGKDGPDHANDDVPMMIRAAGH